jgi:hypothetical protein
MAAKPLDEEARPAAVGKLFLECTEKLMLRSNSWRIFSKNPLKCSIGNSSPAKTTLSSSLASTTTSDLRPVRVTAKEGVAGRFFPESSLPQYFIRARLGWAVAQAFLIIQTPYF